MTIQQLLLSVNICVLLECVREALTEGEMRENCVILNKALFAEQ